MLMLSAAVVLATTSLALAPADLAGQAPTPPAARHLYEGDRVVRLVPKDARELRLALAVTDDVWSHGVAIGRPVDVRVSAEGESALRRAGIAVEVLIPDVAALVDAERARLAAAGQGGIAADEWYADFKPLDAIYAKLDELVAQRPDLVTPFVVGSSLEGREIRGVRISLAGPGAPTILFDGCQHAREWISPMTVTYIAERLVDTADTDPAVSDLVTASEVLVVPVTNPDGYQFSWDEQRLWRKNRRDNGNGTFGVDLNRNWDYAWGGPGSSGSPSSETYRGVAPFSEPESAALRDLYLAHPSIVGSIDFHSYSQLVLWSWGNTLDPAPDDALLGVFGFGMRDAIESVNGLHYTAGPIGPTLYLASGNVVDWAYGVQGVLAYTIELRDTGQYGFVLPPEQIIPTAEENWAAAIAFASDVTAPVAIGFPNGTPSIVNADEPTPIDVSIFSVAGEPIPGTARLFWRTSADRAFEESPLDLVGDAGSSFQFVATLPALVCGTDLDWYVAVETNLGAVLSPAAAPDATYHSVAVHVELAFEDDFERDLGWSVGSPTDTATTGVWVRVDPNGTSAQPENDASDEGTMCWVTGQAAPGSPDGAEDVDGGATTLTSPALDCSNPASVVSFQLWYSNDLGAEPGTDSMVIELSPDDGASWLTVETVTESATSWVAHAVVVSDFIAPSSAVRMRFVASDFGGGSLVEAAVDDVRVEIGGCPVDGDLNGDGVVDASDLAILLGAWGSAGGPADLNGDGVVDAADLAILLGAWSA